MTFLLIYGSLLHRIGLVKMKYILKYYFSNKYKFAHGTGIWLYNCFPIFSVNICIQKIFRLNYSIYKKSTKVSRDFYDPGPRGNSMARICKLLDWQVSIKAIIKLIVCILTEDQIHWGHVAFIFALLAYPRGEQFLRIPLSRHKQDQFLLLFVPNKSIRIKYTSR